MISSRTEYNRYFSTSCFEHSSVYGVPLSVPSLICISSQQKYESRSQAGSTRCMVYSKNLCKPVQKRVKEYARKSWLRNKPNLKLASNVFFLFMAFASKQVVLQRTFLK